MHRVMSLGSCCVVGQQLVQVTDWKGACLGSDWPGITFADGDVKPYSLTHYVSNNVGPESTYSLPAFPPCTSSVSAYQRLARSPEVSCWIIPVKSVAKCF